MTELALIVFIGVQYIMTPGLVSESTCSMYYAGSLVGRVVNELLHIDINIVDEF